MDLSYIRLHEAKNEIETLKALLSNTEADDKDSCKFMLVVKRLQFVKLKEEHFSKKKAYLNLISDTIYRRPPPVKKSKTPEISGKK